MSVLFLDFRYQDTIDFYLCIYRVFIQIPSENNVSRSSSEMLFKECTLVDLISPVQVSPEVGVGLIELSLRFV